jgi:hypothetical protein
MFFHSFEECDAWTNKRTRRRRGSIINTWVWLMTIPSFPSLPFPSLPFPSLPFPSLPPPPLLPEDDVFSRSNDSGLVNTLDGIRRKTKFRPEERKKNKFGRRRMLNPIDGICGRSRKIPMEAPRREPKIPQAKTEGRQKRRLDPRPREGTNEETWSSTETPQGGSS